MTLDVGFGIEVLETIRLRGIDAPEMPTERGVEAREFVVAALGRAPRVAGGQPRWPQDRGPGATAESRSGSGRAGGPVPGLGLAKRGRAEQAVAQGAEVKIVRYADDFVFLFSDKTRPTAMLRYIETFFQKHHFVGQ